MHRAIKILHVANVRVMDAHIVEVGVKQTPLVQRLNGCPPERAQGQ